jgi:hypothetical protein
MAIFRTSINTLGNGYVECVSDGMLSAVKVEKVDPDLVARDEQGKPYTVPYEAVNAMLLNEFLKEHRKVEEQAATIEQQERRLTELERAVAELR